MISPRTLRNLKKEYRRSWLAKLGVGLFALVIFVAIFAPFLAPHNPKAQHLDKKLLPPMGFTRTVVQTSPEMVNGSTRLVNETVTIDATWNYPLGTDQLGQGMLSRVIYGARTSLLVGILGTLIATGIGVPIGLAAGYIGGTTDDTLMRGADIMLAFPALVLAIALVGMFGRVSVSIPDPWVALGLVSGMPEYFVLPGTVILVVGVVNWVWLARIARGEALTIADEEYVKAARSVGASDVRIIARHVLPNALTPIIVLATIEVATIILLSASLAFLGFSGTSLSWGFDIAQGRDLLATAWWIATIPGIAIVITVISVNLIGDWLRDALDPGIEGEEGGL